MLWRIFFIIFCCVGTLFADYVPKNVLVTGGCGFIGSHFINESPEEWNVVCLDKMDYCARKEYCKKSCPIYVGSICDAELVKRILIENNIDTVVHFAAQTHVDNSFGNSIAFTLDNVLGTHVLIEACREYGKIQRFVHISTDEVYGEVSATEISTETSLLNPTNPYAATKAAAEFIVRSYVHSYQFPAVITRGNNVYGPHQYPEKLIPRFTLCLLNNQKCPIHGSGETRRNFIHVKDTVGAVRAVLQKGSIGETYNIGTCNEYSVNEIYTILLKKLKPDAQWADFRENVADRNFNDKRYNIDPSKLRSLGWSEQVEFEKGIEETIEWYKQNSFLYQ